MARIRQYSPKEVGLAAALIAPSLAIFILFSYWPFARIIGWATYVPRNGGKAYEYKGISQIFNTLGTDDFRTGLWLSIKYLLFTVPLGLALGLLLAMVAHRKLRGIRIFQTIFSSTIATSVAVASVVFFVLINPTVGVFKVDWLDNVHTALPALSLITTWRNLGLSFVICLAGLQAVPEDVLEAAAVDGYGAVRRFFKVTIPLLWPVLTFLVVVLSISAFQEFASVDIMTQGAPGGSTELLVYKIYQRQDPASITTGSGYAIGMFIITLVISGLQFGFLNRRVRLD